jgi:hypothetical protein
MPAKITVELANEYKADVQARPLSLSEFPLRTCSSGGFGWGVVWEAGSIRSI